MRKIVTLCVAALLLAAPTASFADTKIAVLNIQEIMRESLAAKSVRKKLEQKQKSFQAEMSNKEKSLQNKEAELAKQRSVLAPDEFEKKVKDFRNQATQAQRDVQKKRAKLDKAFAEALASIQTSVVGIVADMSKEQQFNAVMPTSQLLYADPTLDITQSVLQKLNQKLPSVKVDF